MQKFPRVYDQKHRYDLGSPPDLEKLGYDEEETSDEDELANIPSAYSSSSRESSGSHRPMLSRRPLSKHKKNVEVHKPPSRRIIRYLCLALFTTLIIFILSLIRASQVSSRQLELGLVDKAAPSKPKPWEAFPFLERYFGGLRTLIPKSDNVPEYPSDREPVAAASDATNSTKPEGFPFNPYPSDAGIEECFLDTSNTIRIPRVNYYSGVPQGMPDPVIGAHDVLGLRDDICFDRYGRLGPYGYGYSIKRGGTGAGMSGEREGAEEMWIRQGNIREVDYTNVRWAPAQLACLEKNKHRFLPAEALDERHQSLFTKMGNTVVQHKVDEIGSERKDNTTRSFNATKKVEPAQITAGTPLIPLTAIVIRTWWNHQYSVEEIIYLRSMIAELSILSGGEYTVHFLIHVKDDNVPIWAEKQIYDRVLENSLPEEFRGMGTLWSERQMSLIYGGLEESFFRELPVHGVYRGLYMALQYFSNQHPEYEYLWNWELDVRYTGQWYHLFDRVRQWTKNQPRKGLWERNGRFYVPSVHGSWEDFKQMVRVQSEMGTGSPNNIWSSMRVGAVDVPGSPQGKSEKPIWGPESPLDMLDAQDDPIPPTSAEKDQYEWGMGEEADLITFSPLFDPDGTTWFYAEDMTGYNTTQGLPPRRASIGASSRLSRRLLQTMHRETILARHDMFSEMWPASIALHHGLKAVFAPHPVYIDRRWPTGYLAGVMNGGRNGASGAARTSVYGGREHNFKGQTWFYDAGFSPNLWRRWLGYKVDNDGGEQEEIAQEGRMCLPAMLLHPIKEVNMLVEGGKSIEETEIDPDAEFDWDGTG
ncbi:MAG: hypothetical protein Q9163_006277 [Psora crenata]